MGTSLAPDTPVERRHAVLVVLRRPNSFEAMESGRALIYFDGAFHLTGTEDDTVAQIDPAFYPILRRYYPGEPKSEGELTNEGMIKSLTDMANQPPILVPKRRP
jgi:hypothetical protein